jgi:hypothetical protein
MCPRVVGNELPASALEFDKGNVVHLVGEFVVAMAIR